MDQKDQRDHKEYKEYERDDIVRSAPGETFGDVLQRRLDRRALIRIGVTASAAAAVGMRSAGGGTAEAAPNGLGFQPIDAGGPDQIDVAAGHSADVLLRWGDPIFPDSPPFDPNALTAAAQARQFGYNCDFIGFMPLDGSADRALLVVNHEYTNSELMFAGYDPEQPTADQVAVERMAHGASVVEIKRGEDGRWSPVLDSQYNRRITADSRIDITGPAAGHELLRTNADPTGREVAGMLNNCAGGTTPWGTVLSAEENFHNYFARLSALPEDDPRRAIHDRYGVDDDSDWGWERYHARYGLDSEPNEPFRYGWVVEIDPYDPESTPRKRTALGRFRHEAAETVISTGNHLVLYSGDDARFEFVYKFVSERPYVPGDKAGNMQLLDAGTLYVARFHDDGTGEWLPLVHGRGPLTGENGFNSQADVLINTRGAADRLGATRMDRPEDIEVNPVTGRVYMALTNNTRREEGDTDAANPRAGNQFGHVIELVEDNGDHRAERFTWEVLLLCGDPEDESTYFGGFDKSQVSPIASPDNVTFDLDGNLWIATDGMPKTMDVNDGLFAVPVVGPERGRTARFLAAVAGAEVCGPTFTPDNTSLFVAIQHPGEGGSFESPATSWPDGSGPPRPSVIVVRNNAGGRVGQTAAGESGAIPEMLPRTGVATTGTSAGALQAAGLATMAVGGLLSWRKRRMEGASAGEGEPAGEGQEDDR